MFSFFISKYRLEITYGCLSTVSLSTQPLTLKRKKWWPFKWANLDPSVRLVTHSTKNWTSLELSNQFWPGPNSKPISSWAKNKLPRKLANLKALPNLKMPTMLAQSKFNYIFPKIQSNTQILFNIRFRFKEFDFGKVILH